jgi:cobalt ECF transporter T component CbiQ
MIPEWMQPAPAAIASGGRARRSPVRGAALAFDRLLGLILQPSAEAAGFLHHLEPRAKLVGIGVLVVTATLVHQLALLAALYLASVATGIVSRVRLGSLARIWLAAPIFTAAIALPATLNVVTPGAALTTLWHFSAGAHVGPWRLPPALTVTAPGVIVASRLVLRTATCLSLLALLTASTSPAALLAALRGLGIPRVFVMVTEMMYRYLEVLARAAHDLHLASLSRSLGRGSGRRERRWVAAGIAALFRKTVALSQAVYLAMLSRGYTGEARSLAPPGLARRDVAWIAACCIASACLIAAGRLWLPA